MRIILLPFSVLYGTVILFRDLLYKIGILTRSKFDFPIICVGNLTAGGTGKTPHTEWLLEYLLGNQHKPAVLSRGYKRKTTGYRLAGMTSGPEEIGDEPFQIKQKFNEVPVAVCENRVLGVPELLRDEPETAVIIMDDGFQHLPIKASGYILLTDYHHLYTSDWLLPSGMLREFPYAASRAHVIIVTKCPEHLTEGNRKKVLKKLKPKKHQLVLFSTIKYGHPINLESGKVLNADNKTPVIGFSGIANPSVFNQYLERTFNVKEIFRFSDHHSYSESDVNRLMTSFNQVNDADKILICTEKDAGKFRGNNPAPEHLYYLPIKITFHKNGDIDLKRWIERVINWHKED